MSKVAKEVSKIGLQYSIDVLAALKEAGYSQGMLQRNNLIGSKTLTSLRRGQPVTWKTQETICKLLRCQPSDFMEYVDDDL